MIDLVAFDFAKRIHLAAKKKSFPLRIQFELTYRCNFQCRHCYVPASYREKYRNELTTKEVFLILDELKEAGCFYLGITGGEPFRRRDIFDILRYAKRKGFQVIIYTNASLIDEKKALILARLSPNKIDITLPAISRVNFERVTGVKGTHHKVFKAIALLRKYKVSLGFKTCVLKENAGEINDIQDFVHSLGAMHRLDDLLLPRLDGDRRPYQYRGYLPQTASEKITYPDSCISPPPERGLPRGGELFACGAGRSQAAITPRGELKMCLMIDRFRYNVLDNHFNSAWSDLKRAAESIKIDKQFRCNSCELAAYCKWCPARGWLYSGCFTSCDPENRRKAESIRGANGAYR